MRLWLVVTRLRHEWQRAGRDWRGHSADGRRRVGWCRAYGGDRNGYGGDSAPGKSCCGTVAGVLQLALV